MSQIDQPYKVDLESANDLVWTIHNALELLTLHVVAGEIDSDYIWVYDTEHELVYYCNVEGKFRSIAAHNQYTVSHYFDNTLVALPSGTTVRDIREQDGIYYRSK